MNTNVNSQDAGSLVGKAVDVRPVSEVENPEELIMNCMPAFGGAFVRKIFCILDRVITENVPLVVAISGPITASNQHRAWLLPLIEEGYISYITTTDAACYHDGHFGLQEENPVREVDIEGRDLEYGKAGVIRIGNVGFDENVLYKQDKFISNLLQKPEFQRKMSGTEFRNLLGQHYDRQEGRLGIKPGLLSTCYKYGVPVFVGAPCDGSVYLNHVKLWAMRENGVLRHDFELDIEREVFESAAIHYWGLTRSPAKKLAILILGGGVPKNFSLQPEPFLSQILLLNDIDGYSFDVQIVSTNVTYGCLTSCKPAEAHTWGKVSAEALGGTTESLEADYSTIMPLISWAIIDKKHRLFNRDASEPGVRGYCLRNHLRLYDKLPELTKHLLDRITELDHVVKLKSAF